LPSAVDERRWLLPSPLGGDGPIEAAGAPDGDLPCELLALLRRRGLVTAEAVRQLLDPEAAPDPEAHFPALALAVERLVRCCQGAEAVAICGDYDADGMTSTALLVGVLQRLGARPRAAIPSRMEDGYGLNAAMVERLAAEGVRLLITVDNGVAAIEALERAADLQVEVILTDHHSLPPQLPPHLALLHPAVTPEDSPYRGLAGVGLAHVLATALCRRLRHRHGLEIALNLFCIGTIADMAPLEGVNRRWLLDGLPLLGRSPLPGLQALQQLAGLEKHRVDAEAVGFQLAPRINAVGRLGDPQLVVDLLTTEDPERALELARACEALNRQRRELCSAIEAEALALLEADGPRRPAFLLLAQGHWHHGVIGIVASRLVERFGRPVALLAGEGGGRLRASVRAPKGFAVDGALTACADLLERHGGHPAAGGFPVPWPAAGSKRRAMAARWSPRPCCGWSASTGTSGASSSGSPPSASAIPPPCSGAAAARWWSRNLCAAAICSCSWPRGRRSCGRSPGAGRAPASGRARWTWPIGCAAMTGRAWNGSSWSWRRSAAAAATGWSCSDGIAPTGAGAKGTPW
jgi:single-stranded-DNA-specific exonuclease